MDKKNTCRFSELAL